MIFRNIKYHNRQQSQGNLIPTETLNSSVVWHSLLIAHQTIKEEHIQETTLKITIGDNFIYFSAALGMTGLKKISLELQKRCLTFAKARAH